MKSKKLAAMAYDAVFKERAFRRAQQAPASRPSYFARLAEANLAWAKLEAEAGGVRPALAAFRAADDAA